MVIAVSIASCTASMRADMRSRDGVDALVGVLRLEEFVVELLGDIGVGFAGAEDRVEPRVQRRVDAGRIGVEQLVELGVGRDRTALEQVDGRIGITKRALELLLRHCCPARSPAPLVPGIIGVTHLTRGKIRPASYSNWRRAAASAGAGKRARDHRCRTGCRHLRHDRDAAAARALALARPWAPARAWADAPAWARAAGLAAGALRRVRGAALPVPRAGARWIGASPLSPRGGRRSRPRPDRGDRSRSPLLGRAALVSAATALWSRPTCGMSRWISLVIASRYFPSLGVASVIEMPDAAGAAGAADAVDVVLGVGRHVEVEDVAHRRDIEAARRDVAGDQELQLAVCGSGRASRCGSSGPCRHGARRRREAVALERAGEGRHVALAVAEDDRVGEAVFAADRAGGAPRASLRACRRRGPAAARWSRPPSSGGRLRS